MARGAAPQVHDVAQHALLAEPLATRARRVGQAVGEQAEDCLAPLAPLDPFLPPPPSPTPRGRRGAPRCLGAPASGPGPNACAGPPVADGRVPFPRAPST